MGLTCLDNIIGLSNTACNCWDASKPVDFNTLNASSSGLYVAAPDTIPLRWTSGAADCENGGIWTMLISAREEANRNLLKDFLGRVQSERQEKFDPFVKIGDDYRTAGSPVYDTFAAAYIQPYQIKGGLLRIKSIDIAFYSGIAAPTNVQIDVYSSLDLTTSLGNATANVTANNTYATATFASELVIDLGNVREDLNQRFYFVYQVPVGALPVNNQTYIPSCCGKSVASTSKYMQILRGIGGSYASSVATLLSPTAGLSTMMGMVINGSMECDYYSWLCQLAQVPNQVYSLSNGQRLKLGMALADGLQAGAVMSLVKAILNSGRINQYTMILEDKRLYAIANSQKKRYDDAIHNLTYYMPWDVSDCLICAKSNAITKGGIFVK
jgi:hypothetical protein